MISKNNLWNVLIVFAVASAIGAVRYKTYVRSEREVAEVRAALYETTNALRVAETEHQSIRAQVRDLERLVDGTSRHASALKAELTKQNPEIRNVTPPENLPWWSDDSQYIWMRKDRLGELPITTFDSSGRPDDAFLDLLVPTKAQKQRLKTELPKILQDYRKIEAAQAQYIDEPLPGISNGEIRTVRIEPAQREGAELRARFVGLLTEILGQQRAGLFKELGEIWLDNQFGAKEPKIVSLVRHPDGAYNISVKQPSGGWMSCGIWKNAPRKQFSYYIPSHILPMFNDLLPPDKEHEAN